ncbi:MAG TPA: hypothetical protein VGF71_01900 [Caulobacteraceae bacterium]
MMRQTGLAGDIDHPDQADGGVGDESDGGPRRPTGAKLEHVVDEHLGFPEIDDDVVDRLADDAGRERPVQMRERPDRIPAELFLEFELLAVELLERIAPSRRPAWLGSGPCEKSQRHGYGDRHCAQGSLHSANLNPDSGGALRKPMETFGHYAPPSASCLKVARLSNQSSAAMTRAAPGCVEFGWSPI